MRARRELRLGSYSIAATLPGTLSLSLLKSTMRYCFLWPPPWWRTVIEPLLLRPAFLDSLTINDFSGFLPLVTSLNVDTLMKRRPGLVGLYFLTAISRCSSQRGGRSAGREPGSRSPSCVWGQNRGWRGGGAPCPGRVWG